MMENVKGILGLMGIWGTWFVAHMGTIQTWASIMASIAATVASVIYGWYWLGKITRERKVRKNADFKSNGQSK